jgi:prenyltransferase beta subunit
MRRVLLAGLCLLVVSLPARTQSAAEKQATIAYLQKFQTSNGGFLPAPDARSSSLRATNAALRALKYFGGELSRRDACGDFVKSCFDKETGGFADMPGGKPDVATTAVGLMAVFELKLPTEPYTDVALAYLDKHSKNFEDIRIAAAGLEAVGKRGREADAWLDQIGRMRHGDGSFGDKEGVARATGGATAAILRLGGKVEDPKAILAILDKGQRPDGGFGKEAAAGSDLESTYRVMRCYHMLKGQPKASETCRDFVAKCRNADGGYGVVPGQPSSIGGTYYAGSVLHWLDEK